MEIHNLLVVITLSFTTDVAKCCLIAGVSTVTSHRLLGYAYRNTSGITLSSCVSLCKSDTYCVSVNYDFVSKWCELNERNTLMAPGNLKHWPVNFYVYLERVPVHNLCSFTSCQNGGICEFDKESLKIWCRCRNGYIGRRCEVCGNNSLGLQDGRISDVSFTASSSKSTNLPHMARFNKPKSWMPQDNDTNRYLQIDLAPHRYFITKIAFRGDDSGVSALTFKVKYKDSNNNWQTVGNEDLGSFKETVFEHTPYAGATILKKFDPPITSTVIRILPQESNSAYKLELYGCRLVK
ncbi:lactadherin-like [Actinia tenebrosa]|uniref:Lactadherin-like n=1 Tax=Actinia tenebrosa TaxID=6105 RepID=A0A6P8HLM6_ACTTE|nr:lactadherin-like [Actinia tenebrosa]